MPSFKVSRTELGRFEPVTRSSAHVRIQNIERPTDNVDPSRGALE